MGVMRVKVYAKRKVKFKYVEVPLTSSVFNRWSMI